MNLAGVLYPKAPVSTLVFLQLLASAVLAQETKTVPLNEQTSFGVEGEFEHPVPLNKAARAALASDQSVADVLKDDGLTPDTMPEKWFTTAELHLSSSGDPDLVVRGEHGFRGAYTTTFWVLRKSSDGYIVVFREGGQYLQSEKERTNGLCNILTGLFNLRGVYSSEYAFDGKAYKLVKRTSEPNGYKSNLDVAAYKNRKSFVQVRGQNQERLLAEARDWMWEQWQSRRSAYVRVSTHDDDGEEHECSYFFEKNAKEGKWQATLKIHEIVWDQDTSSGPRYMVTQDNIFVAAEIQRIVPPVDDDAAAAQVYSPAEQVPGAKYRLCFLDSGEFTVYIQ